MGNGDEEPGDMGQVVEKDYKLDLRRKKKKASK